MKKLKSILDVTTNVVVVVFAVVAIGVLAKNYLLPRGPAARAASRGTVTPAAGFAAGGREGYWTNRRTARRKGAASL